MVFCYNVPKTVNLLKTVKITYFCHQKWKNSTLIDKNLRILPVFIWFWCFIKSEIFIWLYQTLNMPIVFRFAYWLKNGITHQIRWKLTLLWRIVTFWVILLKTVKIPFFCHQKWKNSTVIDNKSFLPFWNQETKQIIMGVNSRQLAQVRFTPEGS